MMYIDSICELSMYNEELTKKAVEFLVGKFFFFV